MYSPVQCDPRGGHNRNVVNSSFFQTWNPQMAYVLGYIFADGAIEDVQKSSRTCYLSIVSKDIQILESIRVVIGSTHNFYIRKARWENFGDRRYLSSDLFVFRIGSKRIYNDLLKLGVTPRKSLTISFPKVPVNCLSFFIRGYFDGDGCIHLKKGKYPRLIFTSGSKKFLEKMHHWLKKLLSLSGRVYISHSLRSNICYQLAYNSSSAQLLLSFMYKNLDLAPYLERKYKIYQKYLGLHQ